jgi:hypothetical protein
MSNEQEKTLDEQMSKWQEMKKAMQELYKQKNNPYKKSKYKRGWKK